MDTTWTFTFTATAPITPSTATKQADHILVKMPRGRFLFKRTGATSTRGTVYVIDNFISDKIYYFIIVTA